MSREEQLSFFSQWTRIFSEQLQDNATFIIKEIKKIFANSHSREFQVKNIQNAQIVATQFTISTFHESLDIKIPATKFLTIESLCIIHAALLFDQGDTKYAGIIRDKPVWIGRPGSQINDAIYVPPDADIVLELTRKLLKDWALNYDSLVRQNNPAAIIRKLAEFHSEFLKIHPFFDGNGKTARFLLARQAKELLMRNYPIIIENNKTYFRAIEEAGLGNLIPLESIINQAIYGVENPFGTTK